jgi:hypothetical protein
MFNKIKEFFTGKPAEVKTEEPAAPYKIDPIPAGTEASIIAIAPTVEAVVVVPEAVVPAGIVEQAPAKKAPAKRGPAKRGPAKSKAPTAPAVKKPRAPKAK